MQNSKLKISFHETQIVRPSMGTLGMSYFLNALKDSGYFEIDYHNFYLQTCRDFRATTLFLNGKKIYLDFWEYPTPTFSEAAFNEKFDLIFKLQIKKMSFDYFKSECKKNNFLISKTEDEIKTFFDTIVPWSFFPSRLCSPYTGRETELWSNDIKVDGFFCGKDWRARRSCKQIMQENQLEYICSDQEKFNIITDESFMQKMKESKYGIVFPGRGSWCTDTKNRREIDYMMMKKPLLMTYEPYYYNALIPGYHYIKLERNMRIKDIDKNFDINFIAANGYKWYLDNASPKGLADTFLKIIKEKFNL